MKYKILLAAGGTGGHLFPAVAISKKLKERGHDVYLMIDQRAASFQKDMEGISIIQMPLGPKGPGVFGKIKFILSLVYSTFFAFGKILTIGPKVIVAFGGYPSFPVLMARALFVTFIIPLAFMVAFLFSLLFTFVTFFPAYFMGFDIPTYIVMPISLVLYGALIFLAIKKKPLLILHEQNAYLGRVNQWFSSNSSRLALSFPNTRKIPGPVVGKSSVTGMPLRPAIMKLTDIPYVPPKKDGPIFLLILGGSQGTQVFGEMIPKAIAELPAKLRKRLVITQQARPAQVESVKEAYNKMGIDATVAAFFDNVESLLTQAHLVISRSGSSSTWEVITAKRPTLFIPLPTAKDDHQTYNARYVQKTGGAWEMKQSNLTPEKLSKFLEKLIEDPDMLCVASQNLEKITPQNATETLVELIENV